MGAGGGGGGGLALLDPDRTPCWWPGAGRHGLLHCSLCRRGRRRRHPGWRRWWAWRWRGHPDEPRSGSTGQPPRGRRSTRFRPRWRGRRRHRPHLVSRRSGGGGGWRGGGGGAGDDAGGGGGSGYAAPELEADLLGGAADLVGGSVSITYVRPPNNAPVARPTRTRRWRTPADRGRAWLLSNDTDDDGDALTPLLVSSPSHGGDALNGDGSFAYAPDDDFTGEDTSPTAPMTGSGTRTS